MNILSPRPPISMKSNLLNSSSLKQDLDTKHCVRVWREEGWWVKKLRCFFAKYLYIITTRVVGSSFVSYCRNIRMVAAIYKCLSCHSLTSLATTLLLNTIYCICAVLYYILSSISNLVMCETMRQYIYVVKIITHNNL